MAAARFQNRKQPVAVGRGGEGVAPVEELRLRPPVPPPGLAAVGLPSRFFWRLNPAGPDGHRNSDLTSRLPCSELDPRTSARRPGEELLQVSAQIEPLLPGGARAGNALAHQPVDSPRGLWAASAP